MIDGRLTLTAGSHVRHCGVVHHSCRPGTSHHSWIRARLEGAALGAHGELLRVIHHLLRLAWRWARLHMSIRLWRGAVERWTSTRVWVAIRSRVHGWTKPEPGAGRE